MEITDGEDVETSEKGEALDVEEYGCCSKNEGGEDHNSDRVPIQSYGLFCKKGSKNIFTPLKVELPVVTQSPIKAQTLMSPGKKRKRKKVELLDMTKYHLPVFSNFRSEIKNRECPKKGTAVQSSNAN